MAEATFTFRVDPALKRDFTNRAREMDRAGSQVLREFMRNFVKESASAPAYDEWFRAQVKEAQDDPRPPIAGATVEAHFARRRAAARPKTSKRRR